jgi:DNA-binding transcriptional LysR family regulator
MQVVVAVAEQGGFSAAARRLHVVQSAVSGTVSALERELDAQLFQRTTHRVALTPAGEAFVPAARAALQAAEQARAAVDVVKGELRGRVTVGVMQGLYPGLNRALADFHRAHPAVAMHLRNADAAELRQRLQDSTVDLAVIALERVRQRGLLVRMLAREEMALVAAPDSTHVADGPIMLDQVAELPLVDFSPGWAVRRSVDRAFRAAHLERSVTFEVNDLLAAADLVRLDLGVCIMPGSIAARFPDLNVHPIARHAPTWQVMAVRKQGNAPPAVAALMSYIK